MSSGDPGPVAALEDELCSRLGCSPDQRSAVFAELLRRDVRETTGYWLQLLVAVVLATLGLVLSSPAVIIGAMLVAPLMGPIVAFAMGLGSGAPFLVLRSGGRVVLSVGVCVGAAALLTRTLPFHELNAEIIARTRPTILDLLVAAFCALAGVYSTLRRDSNMASTAAGTSIGISLVPPLCAAGFGLGTGLWRVAGGAALLFVTNFAAIVVVGTLAFVVTGFGRVDVADLERSEMDAVAGASAARWVARRLAGPRARGGRLLRVLMPLALLGVVYVPLRRALDEVAWQVRTRGAVRAALERLSLRVVQSRVRVEGHEVDVQLVVVGRDREAASARQDLVRRIREAAGVAPRVEVYAVPDAAALSSIESALSSPSLAPQERPSPTVAIPGARRFVRAALERRWPAGAAGAPLRVALGLSGEAMEVRVLHLGPALDASAREAIERALGEDLDAAVVLLDRALPVEPLEPLAGERIAGFTARLGAHLHVARDVAEVAVCVEQPPPPAAPPSPAAPTPSTRRGARPPAPAPPSQPPIDELGEALRAVLADQPRVALVPGQRWRVRFVRGPCVAAAPSGGGASGSTVSAPAVPATDASAGDASR